MRYQNQMNKAFGLKVTAISYGLNTLSKVVMIATLGFGPAVTQIATATDHEFAIGTRLANMLRASRSVISANQSLIN
jgi:hypothetical protein